MNYDQHDPTLPPLASHDPFGLFYTWWRGDSLPELAPIVGLSIEPASGDRATGAGVDLDPNEIRERIDRGHDLYIARIGDELVAWGWSATLTAGIGELGIEIVLPTANRYLWDFVTLPAWRGQGIYPHMLQAMVIHGRNVERFWVGHDFSNVASGRGILRSGFKLIGELYPLDSGGFVLCPLDDPERTRLGASLLGVSAECERLSQQ